MKLCPMCGGVHEPWDCPKGTKPAWIVSEFNKPCSICGSKTCEGTHELDASTHQWVLTSHYCNLRIDLSKAESLLKRIINPISHDPEPFYDLLADITNYFSTKENDDNGKDLQ
jgi:hypothetical protein